ncbi:C-8 sterol isomerase [Euphorbia peplus]|nr:C-8 sterol isomerase [Euphorbia peplus]
MKSETSSSSSPSSSNSTTAMEDRDSCYYPGCRKDANCNCEICIASINATLDLMPHSIQKSSLTKLSSSRPIVERTPVSFSTSTMSTPVSNPRPKLESPDLKSTARLEFSKKKEMKRRRERRYRGDYMRFFLGLSLLFAVEIGFSWGVLGVLRPVLSSDMVSDIGKRSRVLVDVGGKLRFLQNEIKGFVADHGKVSNCSHMESLWKINQDGLLLNSRCVLYKSAMEEVCIWGWPLQTSGMLRTGFSSRSFTILSGRASEWSDGMIGFTIRKANSSWTQKKWSSSVVQLDPSTLVLEYRRSSISDYSCLSSALAELFKHWISRVVTKMKHETLFFSFLESGYNELQVKHHVKVPT